MSTGPNFPSGYTLKPLVSMADIASSANISSISSQVADTARLQTLFSMDPEVLKTQIVEWINLGAPSEKILWTQSFPQPQYLTLNGQYLQRMRYILTCLNMTRPELQSTVAALFPGLKAEIELRDTVLTVFIRL